MSAREVVACLSCGSEAVDERVETPAQLSRSDESFTFVRCAACGLLRLSPRPAAAELARWYDDYVLHADPKAWGRYAKFVARAFRAQDRARVRTVTRARPPVPESARRCGPASMASSSTR